MGSGKSRYFRNAHGNRLGKAKALTVKKIQVGFVLAVVVLFLGWLPKFGADRVHWYLDNDFAHYYLTAKLVRNGMNPYLVQLSPLYAENGFTPTRDVPQAGAPPALAAVMAPLAGFSPFVAFGMWSLIQLAALVLGVLVLLKERGPLGSWDRTALLLAGAVAPLGVFAHLRYGQVQALIFFLIAVGVVLVQREDQWSSRIGALLWGMASSLKLFTVPLVFVAWRYRGKGGVVWFALGFVLLWVPVAVLCGPESITTFLGTTLPYIRDLSVAFNGNCSLAGALTYTQRIFAGSDVVSVASLQVACMALIVPLVLIERREKPDIMASTMIMVTASCLLSPTTWPHYFPLLTGGFIYLLQRGEESARPQASLALVLALYLCLGSALGYIGRGDVVMQVVSAWWAPMCMIGMIALVWMARRRSGVFAV